MRHRWRRHREGEIVGYWMRRTDSGELECGAYTIVKGRPKEVTDDGVRRKTERWRSTRWSTRRT